MYDNQYVFLGRVLPERVNVTLPSLRLKGTLAPDDKPFEANLNISVSTITVHVYTNTSDIATLRNIITQQVSDIVATFGFGKNCAYRVEISALSDTNSLLVFPVTYDEDTLENATAFLDKVINLSQVHSSAVRWLFRAMSDYRDAVLTAQDTAFYCQRAIESLRHQFPGNKSSQWETLRKSLNIDASYFIWIKSHGDAQRHGEVPFMSGEERKSSLQVTRTVIQRFAEFIYNELNPLDPSSFPRLQ